MNIQLCADLALLNVIHVLSWFVHLWTKIVNFFFKHTMIWPNLKKFSRGSSNLFLLCFTFLKNDVNLHAEKLRGKPARRYCLNTQDQNKHCNSSTICTRSGKATGTTLTEKMDKLPVCRQRAGILLLSSYSPWHSTLLPYAVLHVAGVQDKLSGELRVQWWDPTILPADEKLLPQYPTTGLSADPIHVNSWQCVLALPFLSHTQDPPLPSRC